MVQYYSVSGHQVLERRCSGKRTIFVVSDRPFLINRSSLAVEQLAAKIIGQPIGLAYIYCDYRDQKGQTAVELIGSLVKQLVLQLDRVPPKVMDMYKFKKKNRTKLELHEATNMLNEIALSFEQCFICIDGLDESGCRRVLYKALFTWDLVSNGKVRLLLTGRPHIRHEILPNKTVVPLEIIAHPDDVNDFLRHRIEEDRKERPADMTDDLKAQIVSTIASKAQGM